MQENYMVLVLYNIWNISLYARNISSSCTVKHQNLNQYRLSSIFLLLILIDFQLFLCLWWSENHIPVDLKQIKHMIRWKSSQCDFIFTQPNEQPVGTIILSIFINKLLSGQNVCFRIKIQLFHPFYWNLLYWKSQGGLLSHALKSYVLVCGMTTVENGTL